MKTILCYGDSNTWGCAPMINWDDSPRYGPDVRWGSVMRTILGDGYWVVEEGLGGRTTIWNDPVEGEQKNGKMYLPACLESHQPIDLVILMLGTNDLKHRYGLSAWDIAASAGTLVNMIQTSTCGPNKTAPKVLLICPPPLGKLTLFAEMLEGGTEKSRQLPPHYKSMADRYGCVFFDAGQIVKSSDRDGVHFEPEDQQKLGRAVAAKVKEILG